MRYNKYHNNPVITKDGKFDSQFEADYWQRLKILEAKGEIKNLQRQVEFVLIPRQYEAVEVQLKTKTKTVSQFREHPCTYRADFVYEQDGKRVIVDTKGFKTPDYIIKRKLMRWQGNPITEVSEKSIDAENKKKVLAKMRKSPNNFGIV